MWCLSVRLWVRQTLPVSRHACAHCCMYFSASRGRPLLDDERTPVVSKILEHAASRSTKKSCIQLRNFVLALTFSTRIFSAKSNNFLGNGLRVTFFPGKNYEFSENVILDNFRGKFVTRFLLGNFFIILKKIVVAVEEV